jgi:hypothetical protein
MALCLPNSLSVLVVVLSRKLRACTVFAERDPGYGPSSSSSSSANQFSDNGKEEEDKVWNSCLTDSI